MPGRDAEDEDWDDEDDEFEGGSDDDEDEPTVAFPHCGRQIHEDAQRCPYCERYISDEDAPRSRKSRLIIIGTLLALYAVYHWIVG